MFIFFIWRGGSKSGKLSPWRFRKGLIVLPEAWQFIPFINHFTDQFIYDINTFFQD